MVNDVPKVDEIKTFQSAKKLWKIWIVVIGLIAVVIGNFNLIPR